MTKWDAKSYRDRTGIDLDQGAAIEVRARRNEVGLELGVMRPVGVLATDAWAALTPFEARELARDLEEQARIAEAYRG
ncbi:hypothetical protein [Methylobacterium gnaphalii]|uniref:Uncharacterized protein n=1 Tax=Methylobacterium gnaphalii TaxID=1010610 RepID=A0A512JQR6_9HYPH|nr:hypothetical protein [Methylobacterium gnaphalii]GEP12289.1 hypothetical protein MGN01_41340 [Methylobacterium gnaphalii]GJD68707.1 hypothetical protein MMMDOFMJ_1631 [Methylobacterium gnaphalii]GLS49396.1 hypothetical protein GCM10007885_22440 [Methylobacterium gnaphalii]